MIEVTGKKMDRGCFYNSDVPFFFLSQILANFINIQFLLCKECKLKSKNKNKQNIKSLICGEEDDLGIAYRGEDEVAFFLGIKHYLK